MVVDVDSGPNGVDNTLFLIILIEPMDNVRPILGHFWECLPKRCIVAPNRRGGGVIVPQPAGTASTL